MTGVRGPDTSATAPPSVGDAVARMQVRAPSRGNRKLEALLASANDDLQLKAWWHMQQTTANRLGMSDHGWVHMQIVLNLALRILRLLHRRGVEPACISDHGLSA